MKIAYIMLAHARQRFLFTPKTEYYVLLVNSSNSVLCTVWHLLNVSRRTHIINRNVHSSGIAMDLLQILTNSVLSFSEDAVTDYDPYSNF